MLTNLEKKLKFIELVDEMKNIKRIIFLKNGSFESDAEHSFHLAIMVMTFIEDFPNLNYEKSLKLALVHDFVEIYAGDTPAFNKESEKTKHQREKESFERLKNEFGYILPELIDLIYDYENKDSPEAKFVYSIDKVQPIIQAVMEGTGKAWFDYKIDFDELKQRQYGKIYEEFSSLKEILDIYFEKAFKSKIYYKNPLIMTKIIGIDLDEVLAETMDQILEDNNYMISGKKVSREDVLDYYIYHNKDLNITRDDGARIFHETYKKDFEVLEIKTVYGAKKKLEELKDKGYTLKIVSARPEDIEIYTKKWLDKHFANHFESVHFANHFNYNGSKKKVKKKSEICKELGIKIMIEDIFDYALDLAENGILTYIIEKPWNKHILKTHKNIIKVKSWEEINI
ncbi:MAG: HD domain-containing protein [Candidatus Gracilibacteria bacterium]|nr:HD domain-containing protein [Candidatus Gracilibacteria bacterium]